MAFDRQLAANDRLPGFRWSPWVHWSRKVNNGIGGSETCSGGAEPLSGACVFVPLLPERHLPFSRETEDLFTTLSG
jgi:hypothetical protein